MSTAVLEMQKTNTNAQQSPAIDDGRPPQVQLTQIITGSLASQAVYVAAKLGLADLLAAGPKSAGELAAATETDGPALYRVLRALASCGLFIEQDNRVFALTPTAELLRSDAPGSLRDLAIFFGEDWHWNVWGQTLYSVRTGKAAWEQVHGAEVFPYFAAHAEASRIFDRAMTSLSNLAIKTVVEGYDFSEIETLVDVAGGHGGLLTAILAANPSLKGVLFDQPHVIEGAKERVAASAAAARCTLVSGDFFATVPAGADAYIMKHIIHDWDDGRAIKILKNVRREMKKGGRVLLVETVITPGNEFDFAKLLDIEMLVSPGGKERTESEYGNSLPRPACV
jgi:hypothetical protein